MLQLWEVITRACVDPRFRTNLLKRSPRPSSTNPKAAAKAAVKAVTARVQKEQRKGGDYHMSRFEIRDLARILTIGTVARMLEKLGDLLTNENYKWVKDHPLMAGDQEFQRLFGLLCVDDEVLEEFKKSRKGATFFASKYNIWVSPRVEEALRECVNRTDKAGGKGPTVSGAMKAFYDSGWSVSCFVGISST